MKVFNLRRIVVFFLLVLTIIPSLTYAQLSASERARLERELKDLEKQIIDQEGILNTQKQQTASLERDLEIVKAKITKAQLNIKAKNVEIQQLSQSIDTKSKEIGSLEDQIEKRKELLAAYISKAARYGDMAYADILLRGGRLSEVFEDADQFHSLQSRMVDAAQELDGLKINALDQKDDLLDRRDQVAVKRAEIEGEKKEIERLEAQQKQLVNASKQQESSYAAVLAERKRKATEIKNRLFDLRDSEAIPFGRAYELALQAQAVTGVRPAFLLGILTQESALGKNVGSCYLTNFETGAGVGMNTGTPFAKVMSPTRDVPIFKRIAKDLGLEPTKTRVSCPQSFGWGGAMGPAQFIPSTWTIFEDRIAARFGVQTANPWNPEHAILASSMLLAENGAGRGTYEAERNAACRYYSGQVCSALSHAAVYGNQVMLKASNIQANMIDLLRED